MKSACVFGLAGSIVLVLWLCFDKLLLQFEREPLFINAIGSYSFITIQNMFNCV